MDARVSQPIDGSKIANRWFWATVAVAAVQPAIAILCSEVALRLNFPAKATDPADIPEMLLIFEALTLWPFLFLAVIVRRKLRNSYNEGLKPEVMRRTKAILAGAIAGMGIPYALMWIAKSILPWTGAASEPPDFAVPAHVLGAGLFFGLPAISLISAPLGAFLGRAFWKSLSNRESGSS